MQKFIAAILAMVLAAIATQVAVPMTAAKAVPASWINKVMNERKTILEPSASVSQIRQPREVL